MNIIDLHLGLSFNNLISPQLNLILMSFCLNLTSAWSGLSSHGLETMVQRTMGFKSHSTTAGIQNRAIPMATLRTLK